MNTIPDFIKLAAACLELRIPFSSEDINKAFRKIAFKKHPDHGGSTQDFIVISLAKEILNNYQQTETSIVNNWKRSRKGNLFYKIGENDLVTVFKTKTGKFKWIYESVSSKKQFYTENEACRDAERELGF